jgi:hypothetical protein
MPAATAGSINLIRIVVFAGRAAANGFTTFDLFDCTRLNC